MRIVPGFFPYLQDQLHSLRPEQLERMNDATGFDISTLMSHVVKPRDYTVYDPYEVDPSIVDQYSQLSHSAAEVGLNALDSGQVAFCVLAGGAGTRAGGTKALLRVPGTNESLLSIKLAQAGNAKHVWVMTSPSNHDDVKNHLIEVGDQTNVQLFQQFESVRLTPDNMLYLKDCEPSFYPCGHGDVIPALQKSGIIDKFLSTGGKHIILVNADNLLASLDLKILGHHVESDSAVTCEVVQRTQDDRGGILCNHMGFDQIVEQFRFHASPDSQQFKWFSTNSYVVKADLDFSSVKWSWHRVKKELGGHLVIQHERLIQDLTATFQTRFIEVPREQRFMPVKTSADLDTASRIFRKI